MRNKKFFKNRGFGMIEIIIGSAVISLSFLGLMAVANISLKVLEENNHNLKASFLLEEGAEAVKIMRDSGWSNISSLASGADYYFDFNGLSWQSTTTNVSIDNLFERKFVVEDVYRDGINDDIVSSGGILDPGTKKVTVYVSWRERESLLTEQITTYVANIFE